MHTAGTAHGDVAGFIASHRASGEGGVLVGRSAAPVSHKPRQLRYADALQATLGDLPCPVVVDMDIGHVPPQLVLVNGALATVHLQDDGLGWVEQRLV